ncbi:Separin [Echinococcus granulosus]|nr:Separin [Echinococcus granulosus]
MHSLDSLELFFDAYEKATYQIRRLIPSLDETITTSLRSHLVPPQNKLDEEVYAGLPTLHNARPLFQALAKCPPSVESVTHENSSKLSGRQFLCRLELVATVASIYELHSTEAAAWQAIEVLSRHTQRVIDEVYGLVNRAFLKLRIAEQTCFADRKELTHKIGRIQSALKSKSSLLSAYEDLVTRVRLPTAHTNLQCVVADSLLVYLEHYDNFCSISSRLDIVLMRHKDFLDSKVWAAVYCRAFINWLVLRARLSTGAPPIPVTDEDAETPVSSLFAAINIKTHGRTLVKFIMSHIEPKIDQCDGDKENQVPGESLHSKRLTASDVPVSDMVNLWLGSRLLLNGTLQVAELYTLLGTVKEARVYQLELLRIAQRFHNPCCAQSAICMMAYTDLISQRKWAFDLRLSQLNHILNSIVSLDDIIKSREAHLTNKFNKFGDGKDEEDDEESSFLQRPNERKHPTQRLYDSEGEEEYDGMATNPVVDALAGGLPDLYPATPIKGIAVMNSPSGYPSLQTLTRVLSKKNGQRTVEEEGVFTTKACAHRILNGCLWVWVGEVSDLIRTKVIGRDHFFSALIPPSQTIEEKSTSPDDLSTMLESKCSVSSNGFAVTPARPMTKAARAAARAAQMTRSTPLSSTDQEDILNGSVHPPNAPRRLDISWLNDVDAVVASRTRRGISSTKDSSAPADTRKKIDGFESIDYSRGSRKPVDFSLKVSNAFETPVGCSPAVPQTHLGSSTSNFVFGREPRAPLQILRDTDVQKESAMSGAPEYSDTDDGERMKEEAGDPVETCPAVAFRVPLPRNVKLTKKYLFSGHPRINLAPLSPLCDPPETLVNAQDAFADRLYSAYSSLSALPVPHLLRPVCQWLGLRWLGLGNQGQAARYFGQATGIAACGLFTSILSSKLKFEGSAESLRSIYAMSAPNDSSAYLNIRASNMPPVNVVQLMLVDELGQLQTFDDCDSDGTQPARDLVSGGLGSRKQVYLIATRWVLGGPEAAYESRVIHRFSFSGLQYLKDFSDLQSQNVESMQEEDRRRFWSLRFSLDSRLKNLIDEMRNQWFTIEDLEWIKGRGHLQASLYERPCILVLDRQLTLLPWEWLIWGQWDENEAKCNVPAVCRNFSISLVIGHLSLTKSHFAKFDPDSTFYVVNPEANLSHTESTFKSYFDQNFPNWDGILGRAPQAQEVLRGFTQKDLFVYLGHGNGSKCLMSAFDEGQNAKAVAFIIGCSSGRPRLEGRHEAYASVFNHLITGAPTAVSLLWDVTDKDIDRFTQKFIDKWILLKDEDDTTPLSMTWKIFRATKACKLQSLVGKSVVVYGIPAVPIRQKE